MAEAAAAVRLEALGGVWETCGVDRLRGIVPQGISLSANEWGPDRASFSLRRNPAGVWPDLTAFTPVEIWIGGVFVWSGRISETPTREGAENVISVECEGWQYHLDDSTYNRSYVHTRLSDWVDARSFVAADLAYFTTPWTVSSGDGAITLALPTGATAGTNTSACAVLDTGDDVGVKRIVITYQGGGGAGVSLYARQGATPTAATEGPLFDATPIATASTTVGHTFTTARRYVAFELNNVTGASLAGAATMWVRLYAIQVFRDTAYESGQASVIKADTIAKDARDAATSLLSTSNDKVEAQTFSLPEFAFDTQRTPREVIGAVNAYEDCQVAVDVHKRLVFRDKPTAPLFELGNWTGGEIEDASAGSGDEIYNRVIVEGAGPDAQKLSVTRTQSLTTLVGRRGFTRTKILPVGAPGTTASYNQLGDLYLAGHRTIPMKGRAKAVGPVAIRRVVGGAPVHPAVLLLHTGEMLRLANRIDPDTGGQGRDTRIVSVAYNHDEGSADVELDNRRGNFEAFLERLAIVTGQVPG